LTRDLRVANRQWRVASLILFTVRAFGRRERHAGSPEGVRIAEPGPDMLEMDDRLVVNVNTPHDYERAKGLIELKPEPTEDRITTDPTGRHNDRTDH
jgi:GTP:adenosylcobinamide-phosphate guanylyltransferase